MHEGLDCFGVFVGCKVRFPEMAPEAFRVVRVQLHRLANPVGPFLGATEPSQKLALLDHDEIVVRIERESPLLVVASLRQVVAADVDGRQYPLDVRIVDVQRLRQLKLADDLVEGGVLISAPAVAPSLPQDAAPPGMGMRVFGVELQRSGHQLQRLLILGAIAAMVADLGREHAFVSCHAGRRLARHEVLLRGLDAAWQRGHDRRGQLVLDGENVVELAVVSLGPDVRVGRSVDQLGGHPELAARFADAALHQILRAQLLGDFAQVHRLPLVDEGGVARDDEQLVPARQFRDDVLGQAIDEKFLFGIAAHIGEGQDGDRRLDDAAPGGAVARCRSGCSSSIARQTRTGREMFFRDFSPRSSNLTSMPIGDLFVDGLGDAYPADIGHLLEPGGDIDAVAVDVALIEDDVAEIDADAELDATGPPARRRCGGACGSAPLPRSARRLPRSGTRPACRRRWS